MDKPKKMHEIYPQQQRLVAVPQAVEESRDVRAGVLRYLNS